MWTKIIINTDHTITLITYQKACPQCNHTRHTYDPIRDETYCTNCGLVLRGPPTHGITYPPHLNTKKTTRTIKPQPKTNIIGEENR